MEYFDLLPKIKYSTEEFDIRNLFYKFDFIQTIPSKYLYSYRIADGENLETIAFEIYNDPVLWWLLAIINNITDVVFELPLSSEILQKIARDQSTIDDVLDMELFSTNYDILEIENDQKRLIKVLKPQYLKEVIVNLIREIK
jgi:hypothetical protein